MHEQLQHLPEGMEEKPKLSETPIESRMLLLEGREIAERARETFDWHVGNLKEFDRLFEHLDGKDVHSMMRNHLLHRIYVAGELMKKAEASAEEDEKKLKGLEV